MTDPDVRWLQRLDNYRRALATLERALTTAANRELSELEQQGLVKAFEFTYELAWNTLRDLLRSRGNSTVILGSRDAIREAFSTGLINDGPIWMEMVRNRNLTSHVYNRSTADMISSNIANRYLTSFQSLRSKLETLACDAEP